MVEKISEGIAKSIAEVDVSSDKVDFLEIINKKKKDKEPADMHNMAAIVVGYIPLLLNKSATLGGGIKLTDTQVTARAMSRLMPDDSSDKALRNKILAIAGQHNAENNLPPEIKNSVRANDTRATTGEKATAAPLASASKDLSETSLTRSESSQSHAPRLAESESAISKKSIADASLLQRGQAPIMPFPESSFTGPQGNETAARGEKSLARANSMQAVVSGNAAEKQSLDLNYQFQRWSGDHSVKVSIPTDVRGESSITMLPSDTRAADALHRHISQLPGQKAELLQPKTNAVVAEGRRDGNIAAAITDPRAIDSSARLTAQSPEPASELYHAQRDSEDREHQRQQHTQEEEQE